MRSRSKTLRVRTENGGYKMDVSTSWNAKLTSRRRKTANKIVDLPAEVLCREIDAACARFWAKRDVHPISRYD